MLLIQFRSRAESLHVEYCPNMFDGCSSELGSKFHAVSRSFQSCLVGKFMLSESAAEKQNCLTASANSALRSSSFHVMGFWMGQNDR